MFIGILPPYSGRYTVGSLDIEVPSDVLTSTASATSLLVRAFYPCVAETLSKKAPWLPDGPFYCNALVSLVKLPSFVGRWISPRMSRMSTSAHENAELLESFARYPVVIFSHGLGGTRSMYSNLSGSMASKGMVVLAIEHRDGSALATKRAIGSVPFNMTDSKLCEDDTSDLRMAQMETRVTEVFEAVEMVKQLDRGTLGLDLVRADMFKSTLDLNNLILMGHSFGGATVLNVLGKQSHPFVCGIALDPWMQAIRNVNGIQTPFLSIQAETAFDAKQASKLLSIFGHPLTNARSEFGYFPKTSHIDCMDIGILFRPIMTRFSSKSTKNTLDTIQYGSILSHWMTKYIANIVPLEAGDFGGFDESYLTGDAAMDAFKAQFNL